MQLIIAIILAICLSVNPAKVRAETPTPTPADNGTLTKPDTMFWGDKPITSFKIPKSSQWIIDLLPLGQTYEAFVLQVATKFLSNVTIADNKIKEANTVGFVQRFFPGAEKMLKPYDIQNKTVYPTDKRQIQITGRLCIYKPDGQLLPGGDIVSDEKINTSGDDHQASKLFDTASKSLSSYFALGNITPNANDEYSYQRQQLELNKSEALPCETSISTDKTSNTDSSNEGLNQFTAGPISGWANDIYNFWSHIWCDIPLINPAGCVEFTVWYKGSELSMYAANTDCTTTGCTKGVKEQVGYTVEDSEIKSQGWENMMFKPNSVSFSNGFNGGDEQQQITAFGKTISGKSALYGRKKLQDYSTKTMCMLLPYSLQAQEIPRILAGNSGTALTNNSGSLTQVSQNNTDVLGAESTAECVVEQGGCAGNPPDLTPNGSCSLCNEDSIRTMADDTSTVPEGVPPTLKKVLEKAAEIFRIPASSLLAAMYHEGAFTNMTNNPYLGGPYTGQNAWTEANVQKWILCGEPLPNCPADEVTYAACQGGSSKCGTAILGTGQLPNSFWGDGNSGPWTAVQQVDPSRTRDIINPCNFLDSIFATAKELQTWGQYPRTPPKCYGHSMTGSASGSCSSPPWSDDTVLESHIGLWIGTTACCPDGTTAPICNIPGNSNNPNYANMVLGWYHAFKCN